MQDRAGSLALQCHSPCVMILKGKKEFFREQQSMNLRYSPAVLPENICPAKFCAWDILTACALLLVWIYFL